MMERLLRFARRLVLGEQRRLARRWQARLAADAQIDVQYFTRALAVEPGPVQVVLGRAADARGRSRWVGMPSVMLVSQHGAAAGGTGSGKTVWLLQVLIQVLRDGWTVILFDGKGETAERLLEEFLPAITETPFGKHLLDHLHLVRPFDPVHPPALNLTKPQPGLAPEVQALAVASAVEEALGEAFGGQMRHAFIRRCALCIELHRPLPAVLEWLRSPLTFARDAQRSQDPELRAYARAAPQQENRLSVAAASSRLDAFLLTPGTRVALTAPTCLNFGAILDTPGSLAVVDPSQPPVGAERAGRFWSTALVGLIGRAILSRKVGPDTQPAWVAAEEIQEGLTGSQATLLGRLFATARFKSVGVFVTNQSRSQLSAVDPNLVQALRTNVGFQAQFAASPEDAAAFAHALPIPEGLRGADERKRLVRELTRLPRRSAYLWVRSAGLQAHLIRTPRLDLEAIQEAAGRVPESVRDRIRRGESGGPPRVSTASAAVPLDTIVPQPPAPESPASGDGNEFPALG